VGKSATLLEGLCGHALSFGAESISAGYKDSRLWVFAYKGDAGFRIPNYARSSEDEVELRENLLDAVRKPVRTVVAGQVYILKARKIESFGDYDFEVTIERAPKLDPSVAPKFTAKQGQYLAFIYNYTKIHGEPPSEADLQRYFQVSAPSIHEMVKTLERNGLIEKTPGQARSIRLIVRLGHLPRLE